MTSMVDRAPVARGYIQRRAEVAAVATRTRFGAGMYTAEEQDPDSPELQSPEAQQVYLSKAAGLVGASLGAPVPMRVADAVAGDVESTSAENHPFGSCTSSRGTPASTHFPASSTTT